MPRRRAERASRSPAHTGATGVTGAPRSRRLLDDIRRIICGRRRPAADARQIHVALGGRRRASGVARGVRASSSSAGSAAGLDCGAVLGPRCCWRQSRPAPCADSSGSAQHLADAHVLPCLSDAAQHARVGCSATSMLTLSVFQLDQRFAGHDRLALLRATGHPSPRQSTRRLRHCNFNRHMLPLARLSRLASAARRARVRACSRYEGLLASICW